MKLHFDFKLGLFYKTTEEKDCMDGMDTADRSVKMFISISASDAYP